MSIEKLFGEFYKEDQDTRRYPASSASQGRALQKKSGKVGGGVGWPVIVVCLFVLLALVVKITNVHQSRILSLPKKVYASSEGVVFSLPQTDPKQLSATVTSQNAGKAAASVRMEKDGVSTRVTIEPPNNFVPGKYTVSIFDKQTNTTYTQDFSWGVLAINTNKSIYLPGDTAKLSFAVLDETGMMVCDANVKLQISNVKYQIKDELSTENGKIVVNPECKVKDYTEKPDYEAVYRVGGVGTYAMTLTAVTKNGTYSITDSFEVKENVPFDVERVSATRIYPVYPYPVTIKITANQDFVGQVVEQAPFAFSIKQSADSDVPFEEGAVHKESAAGYWYKELFWKLSMKKGEQKTLSYLYKSPEQSPYFFTLGPLEFISSDVIASDAGGGAKQSNTEEIAASSAKRSPRNDKSVVFKELRSWQIAVDTVTTAVEQQVNVVDQAYATTSSTSGPTDNSLGVVNYTGSKYSNESVYFEADLKKTNGYRWNSNNGVDNKSIYCVASDDCKITYYDTTYSALRFKDCDDTTCSTGSIVTLDGRAGETCVITGCNAANDSGLASAVYCPTSDDCKIAFFYDGTAGATDDVYFIDCDNATCSTGSMNVLAGASCTLTGCLTDATGDEMVIDCSGGATDCKVAYYNSTKTAIYFIDCDNATCTTGTNQLVDGFTSCPLTSCNASDAVAGNFIDIDCSNGVTDCKIVYDNSTKTAAYFVDCDSATCGSGTVSLIDGFTGCVLTGCIEADSVAANYGVSIDCPASDDCKIAYTNATKLAAYLADCDSATCSSGTVTLLEGEAGCTLTGCSTADYKLYPSIDCVGGGADCKIALDEFPGGSSGLRFIDCDNAACSTGSVTVAVGTGCGLTNCTTSQTAANEVLMSCVSATDCKVIYYNTNNTYDSLFIADCDNATCGTGTVTILDGSGWGNGDSGLFSDVTCPSLDDCKMVWYENFDTALHFRDCDNASCSTGTTVFLDGVSGCLPTGCLTGDDIGQSGSIYCLSSTDCKIAYINVTKTALYFIDCDSGTCNKSTTTLLDGFTSCVLTSCTTSGAVGTDANPGRNVSLYCIATDDCKIAYAMGSDLYFADCSSATCSSGTVSLLDGAASCVLTGCQTGDVINFAWGEVSMQCPSADDCKIAYHNYTKSALYFADCGTATCSSGTTTLLDGSTSCVLSGCTEADDTGRTADLDCSAGGSDCKIVYWDFTASNDGLNFIDCDSADCTTGTLQNVFGKVGCPLTGCLTTTTNTPNYGASIKCLGDTSDCKIGFYVYDNSAMYFADCDSATCNSGTVTVLDGYTSCVLTGCISADSMGNSTASSMDCVSGSDCKLAYYAFSTKDAIFADCASATCGSGTATIVEDREDEYAWAQLYTSAGVVVADGIAMQKNDAAYSRIRSNTALSLADGDYSVRILSSDDSDVTSTVQAARLVLTQSAGGGITASETQIELGNNETTTSTSYGQLTSPKIYQWDSNNFDGTVSVNFQATLKGSGAGVTASAALSSSSTCSSTVSGSEVSVTGTTWSSSTTASPITLTDSTDYFVCIKTSSGTGSIANAKLLIDQTAVGGLSKMQTVQQMINTPVTDSDSTYTSQNYLNNLVKGNFAGGSVAYYFESTMKTSAGTGYANLYNSTLGSAVTGGELSTASTSYTRVRSSDLAANLTTSNDYDTQLKNSATNTTSVASSWIIITIGSGVAPTNTPTPTFVPDNHLKGNIRLKGNVRFL